MSQRENTRHAIILSGGGADGAYAVGVMKALLSGASPSTNFRPLVPDVFTGTSVGTYNAAFMVSQWEQYGAAAIANLEEVWLNRLSEEDWRCGNGVFRLRVNPLDWLNPFCFIPNPLKPIGHLVQDSTHLALDSLYRMANIAIKQDRPVLERLSELFDFTRFVSRDPLIPILRDTICFDAIRRSQIDLVITATNWLTGKIRLFTNADMTDELGPLTILASSAIPGFFSPVEAGNQIYVDGGVLLNTPLKPAIDAGAEVLHVIYMDPQISDIPLSDIQNTLETLYRIQTIEWAKVVNHDIAMVKRVNRMRALAQAVVEILDNMKQSLTAQGLTIDTTRLQEGEQHIEQALDYRPLTLHLYRPRDDLGGALGLLDFHRERIETLITRGFNDAITCSSEVYELCEPLA